MAKWGSADFKDLKKLQARLKQFSEIDSDAFCCACSKELAARLLSLVIPKTPVGKYPKKSGKNGGTLRRGWTAGKKVDPRIYAQSVSVTKNGNVYSIEIVNPVDYASYVEYGHIVHTRNGVGWVDGKYMLTVSEEELRQEAPAILERKLRAKLKEVFNV